MGYHIVNKESSYIYVYRNSIITVCLPSRIEYRDLVSLPPQFSIESPGHGMVQWEPVRSWFEL